MTDSKTKIAILGGGMGAISAAFHLTNTPELASRHDITIYQLGWRIGGKGASGRNQQRQYRNEEHGLHAWFGFYENAFAAMRQCYEELKRPSGAPLATWKDAFKPMSDFVFFEKYQGRNIPWTISYPTNCSEPGNGKSLPTFWDMADEFVQWSWRIFKDLLEHRPYIIASSKPAEENRPHWWNGLVKELSVVWHELVKDRYILKTLWLSLQLTRVRRQSPDPGFDSDHHSHLCDMLNTFKTWFWDHVMATHMDDDELRKFFIIFDTATAILTGVVEDNLLTKGLTSVDDEEFSAWLIRHGAREIPTVYNSPITQSIYDMVFGYEQGIADPSRRTFAAGTAVNGLLRMVFGYKGAMYWQMQAGMGDTVFVPFYEVLKQRGVKFKFFHAITNLKANHTSREITEIEIVPQVQLTVGEYDPLILVQDLLCFPTEPLWKQLENGSELQAKGINFEYAANPLNTDKRITLQKGHDFDTVILGISIAGLPDICQDIIDHNKSWQQMIQNIQTVRTQAFQLWVNEDLTSLGWQYKPNTMELAYVEPLSSLWAEDQLIQRENWPEEFNVKTIAYWCGVMSDLQGSTQKEVTEYARNQALEYLTNYIQPLWPKATQNPSPSEFNWNLLVDPQGRVGQDRFDSQYWRGNFQPSERYVISAAGSTKFRLRADQSGYQNLFLVGDWTKTGFDAGCIESATMSGMQASRAICGYPQTVVNENDPWFKPASSRVAKAGVPALPKYVDYGGLVTVAAPFQCNGMTLYGFILEADLEKLRLLCKQIFTDPSRGQAEYVPTSRFILMTVGNVEKLIPAAPYDKIGYGSEEQVAFWIQTAAVRRVGSIGIAERLAVFIPYMFLNNPISFASGREIEGYAKNWGWFDFPEQANHQTPPPPLENFTLDVWGLKEFNPGSKVERTRLLELQCQNSRRDQQPHIAWNKLEEAFHDLRSFVFDTQDGTIVLPGLQMVESLFDDVKNHQMPGVFMKQYRDVRNASEACYQAIVEVPTIVQKFSGGPLHDQYQIKLEEVASHPIGRQLGLKDQQSIYNFWIKMDFVLENGTVIWQAPTGGASGCLPWLFGKLFGKGRG